MNIDELTGIQGLYDFWKSIFPNWPDELMNKYAHAISIDAPKFGFAGGGDISGMQGWWGGTISPPAQGTYSQGLPPWGGDVNFSINFGSPSNPRYITTARWDIAFWYGTEFSVGWFAPQPPPTIQTNMNMTFLDQPFGIRNVSLHVYLNYDSRLYYPNFAWNYATYGQLINYQGGAFMVGSNIATYGNQILHVAPNGSATPYNYADTILAMYESGFVHSNIDYGLLYEYQTFRDAYLKNAQQISSNTQLVQTQAQASINAYRQDYNDRAQREKNDLASKKLQILQAIDNQKQTTLQNYQTQLLTAQNLKLTLNQVLHNG